MRVTSGDRTPAHNAAVGGVPNSDHLRPGGAYDLVAPGESTAQLAARMKAAGIPSKQLLDEHNHVHWAPGDMTGGFKKVDPTGGFQKVVCTPGPQTKRSPASVGTTGPQKAAPVEDTSYGGDLSQRFKEGVSDITGGFKRLTKPFAETPAGGLEAGGAVGSAIGGALGAVTSPITAALDQANRPVAKTLGWNPKTMTDVESIAIPGAGLAGDIAKGAKLARNAKSVDALVKGAGAAYQSGAQVTKDAAAGVKHLLSPATVSPYSMGAASAIRSARGTRQLQADQDAERLIKAQKDAGSKPPEWHRAVIAHIENRRSGSTPADMGPYNVPQRGKAGDRVRAATFKAIHEDTPMGRAADTMRDVYQHWRTRAEYAIRRNVGSAPQFSEDYYSHLWKEPVDKVQAAMAALHAPGVRPQLPQALHPDDRGRNRRGQSLLRNSKTPSRRRRSTSRTWPAS